MDEVESAIDRGRLVAMNGMKKIVPCAFRNCGNMAQ